VPDGGSCELKHVTLECCAGRCISFLGHFPQCSSLHYTLSVKPGSVLLRWNISVLHVHQYLTGTESSWLSSCCPACSCLITKACEKCGFMTEEFKLCVARDFRCSVFWNSRGLCKNMYRENIMFRGWQAFTMNVSLKSEGEQARRYQCWMFTTPRNLATGMQAHHHHPTKFGNWNASTSSPPHEIWQLKCILKIGKRISYLCV